MDISIFFHCQTKKNQNSVLKVLFGLKLRSGSKKLLET